MNLPLEILEQIFWKIDCPVSAQKFFEQVLAGGESTLGTQAEFFRFVMTGKRYTSFQKLAYLRQDLPDDLFMYKFAERSLFGKSRRNESSSSSSSSSSLLIGKLGQLRLT